MFKIDKKRYKFIGICLISIVMSIVLEFFFFNFNALTKDDSLEIDVDNCNIYEMDTSFIYQYSFDEAKYVNKIVVRATSTENIGYKVDVECVNEFGANETHSIDDTFLFTNSSHYTYVDKDIVNVHIIIPKGNVNVYGIAFENEFFINKYRIMVMFSIFFILGNIICFSKVYGEKPQMLFLLIGILMGTSMIIMQGTVVMGWDEEVHFKSTHEMFNDHSIENSVATQTIGVANTLVFDTLEEKAQLIQYYNTNAEFQEELSVAKDANTISLGKIGYLPQAIFYKIANILGLGFNQCFMAGRFGNLVVYLALIYAAIRIAKDGKYIVACISLMPTCLYIATLYTYDSFVYALLVLGFVILYNQWLQDKEASKMILITCITVFVIGSLPKAVYIPIVLLVLTLLLKHNQEKISPHNKIFLVGICVTFILVMATFVMPVLIGAVTGDVSIGGDPRGGETNYVWQLLTIFEHPLAYIRMLIRDILSLDNFRNFGFEHLDEALFTNIGLLSVGRYGVMPDKYVCLLIPYLFCLFLWSRNKNVNKKYRKVCFFVFVIIIVLIWTAMYLAFTPVGFREITGVQVRYYLPLLIPSMLLLPIPKIKVENIKLDQNTQNEILFLGVWFFLSYCLYYLMFKSACI